MCEKVEILNVMLVELGVLDIFYYVVVIKWGIEIIIFCGDDIIKLYDIVYFIIIWKYIFYI